MTDEISTGGMTKQMLDEFLAYAPGAHCHH
jgi:hypothetical protein